LAKFVDDSFIHLKSDIDKIRTKSRMYVAMKWVILYEKEKK